MAKVMFIYPIAFEFPGLYQAISPFINIEINIYIYITLCINVNYFTAYWNHIQSMVVRISVAATRWVSSVGMDGRATVKVAKCTRHALL